MFRNASSRMLGGLAARLAAGLMVPAALLAWLWPIGLGGMMPVGGDVTQFFLGLMGFLGESLRVGRVPVWNDLWGYGFPGVAESQLGVFYPPHAVLYGHLDTETAYVVSMVLHTLWGGLGAFWAARRLGISGIGSALAAVSWSASGFFLIHLAHAWSYTTGCWLPWAFGVAWSMLAPGARPSVAAPLFLSLILVLQLLPGHFQLAFQTQVVLGLMVLWAVAEHWGADLGARRRGQPAGAGPAFRKAWAVVLTVVAVYPLAAIQLWPTARLAGLAGAQHDFEYLSGFPVTPFHLVNAVAPGLFHRSPTWRPVVWDPFHAMPEECLTYIGLVPLFLAVMAVGRGCRRDPAIRLLAILALISGILSLGPYVPGFRGLITLPGFSFFRAPARWSLVTALALALLAGKGFDRWPEWPRAGRALRWFVGLAVVWVIVVLGLIELAVLSTERPTLGNKPVPGASPRWPAVVGWFDRAFQALPWSDDPSLPVKDPSFEAVMAGARQPVDPYVPSNLSLAVVLQKSVDEVAHKVFTNQRGWIYLGELWETAVLLVLLWAAGGMSRMGRTPPVRGVLVALTILDLGILGRHRLIDVAPLGPLTGQSPLLARLAGEPRGTRIADPLRNMPMLIGLAPISAYRTLDLPALKGMTELASRGPMNGPAFEAKVKSALRATGTSLRVFAPVENRLNHFLGRKDAGPEAIDDPALARWLYGSNWADEQSDWVKTFAIWRSPEPPIRAWFVPLTCDIDEAMLSESPVDLEDLLSLFGRAEPLNSESPRPEEWTIPVWVRERGCVVVSQLHDPQWTALWIGMEGQGEYEMPILPAFQEKDEPGGWQRVEVPGEGFWMLHLEYEPRAAAEGAAISTMAWTAWWIGAIALGLKSLGERFRTRRI
jgi:hypothetical protein